MQPTVTMPGAALYLGESLEVLPPLADGSVDAVVTDPPFGIGYRYGGWTEPDNPGDYWDWLAPRYRECLRVLRPGGFVAVWQAQMNFRHLWDWFGADIHIYAACKNFVQLRPTPVNYGYDPVVMFYKGGAAPLRPRRPPRNVDFFVADTARVRLDRTRPERAHPSPKTVDQLVEVLANFTAEGGTVLDPFMGSGTTGLAALRTGRRFVGVEIDPAYFEIATRRLAGCDGPLFARPQSSLFPDAGGTVEIDSPGREAT